MIQTDTTASFGYWIRRQRQALDLTQAELARRMGCATVTVSKLERDERRPSRQMAELLAGHLAVPEEQRARFLAAALGERAVDALPLTNQPLRREELPLQEGPARHNLPVQTTPFVGREQELADLQQLLSEAEQRLVTILGAGGSGKTRLSLEVATRQLELFEDGVYFVPLAALDTPESLVTAIAEAMQFTFRPQEPSHQQLLGYLQAKTLLLVLDNFEHLLESVALVQELLQKANEVKILVTSRQRLNLSGETLFHLNGLDFPKETRNSETAVTGTESDFGAITLFLQAARRVRPDFVPTADEWQAISHISRLVLGMPLGLILAAGWITILSPLEIGAEISHNLDFLESTLKDVPLRQRSMRAVFDHSWKLLPDEECHALRQLSIFSGKFNREAAQTVTGTSLQMLNSLVSRSLLQPTPNSQFELHPLLRQYAREKLASDPGLDSTVQNRHGAYYCRWLAESEAELRGPSQTKVLAQMNSAQDNIKVAWRWAVDHQQIEQMDQALSSLYQYFLIRGQFEDGERLFQSAFTELSAFTANSDRERDNAKYLGARLNARRGMLLLSLGHTHLAGTLLRESLETARQSGNQQEIAFALVTLGICVLRQQERSEGSEFLKQALALGVSLGDPVIQADSLYQLGIVSIFQGEFAPARTILQASLELYRQAEYQPGIAADLNELAITAHHTGKYTEAEQLWRESLAIYQEANDRVGMLNSLGGLANVAAAISASRLTEARELMEKSLSIAREISFQIGIGWRLLHLGEILNRMEKFKEAQNALREALDIFTQGGYTSSRCACLAVLGETAVHLGHITEGRRRLAESLTIASQQHFVPEALLALVNTALLFVAEVRLAVADNGSTSEQSSHNARFAQATEFLYQAIHHPGIWFIYRERATRQIEELESALSPEVLATARRQGKSMTVEDAIEKALTLLAEPPGDAMSGKG